MSALVFVVISVPGAGLTAPATLVAAALAVLALGGFVLWELRSAHPMLPLELFRDRNFSGSSFSIVLMSFGTGALLLMLTQYLQFVLGYDPMKAGLALLPYAVAAALFNGVGAGLGQKISNRVLIAIGLSVMALGFGVLAFMTGETGYGMLIAALMLMGIGGGLAGPSAYATLMGAVPPAHAGVGSALNDTVQQVGMALSVAVLGSVLAAIYTSSMPPEARRPPRGSRSAGAIRLGDPGADQDRPGHVRLGHVVRLLGGRRVHPRGRPAGVRGVAARSPGPGRCGRGPGGSGALRAPRLSILRVRSSWPICRAGRPPTRMTVRVPGPGRLVEASNHSCISGCFNRKYE